MTSIYTPLFSDEVKESAPVAPAAETHLADEPQQLTLEYHAEIDPDVHYIPKVTGCFALGALAMGIALNVAVLLLIQTIAKPVENLVYDTMLRMAFVVGITGVGSSLLLVGLKVRDDHTSKVLFARHWVHALGAGAAFSLVVWVPYLMVDRGVLPLTMNRYVLAVIWMCLMALPGFAALWVVGPKHQPGEPA